MRTADTTVESGLSRFRWLDRWLEPRWRALLTWVALAALAIWLTQSAATEQIGDAVRSTQNYLFEFVPIQGGLLMSLVPTLATFAFIEAWFEPIAFLLVLLLVPLTGDAETGDPAASVAQHENQIAQWAPPGAQALEGHFSNHFVGHYFSDQPFEKAWAHYAKLLGINRPYRDHGSEGMGTRVGGSLENRIIHASSGKQRKERVSTLIRRAGGETTTVTISQDGGRLMITVIIQPHRN